MSREISLDDGRNILPKQCFDDVKTRGRPAKKINELGKQIITKLSGYMCTEEEIASFLEVTVETLHNKHNYDTFLECIKNGKNFGKISLRQYQFKQAKTNPSMAIWLGKQYLGQKEIPEVVDEDDVIIFKNDIPKVD